MEVTVLGSTFTVACGTFPLDIGDLFMTDPFTAGKGGGGPEPGGKVVTEF